ncbi:MAG: multiubiquitin domain-containing protein [Acidobacteriota bacterium]|nr:multiubiquitin domain-containing protein [Acidobacteriota bacterium]
MSNPQESTHEDQGKKKDVTIIVNGQPHSVEKSALSFTEVVALAFSNPPTGPNVIFTITYRRGLGDKPEGTLVQGETVKVKDGMIFNVTATDRS